LSSKLSCSLVLLLSLRVYTNDTRRVSRIEDLVEGFAR
jgi:hypothetical protein